MYVYVQFKRFREGCGDLEYETRSGRKSTARNSETVPICELVAGDRQMAIMLMEDKVHISRENIRRILYGDWGKREI
jgi:hypothetical protein